MKAIILFILLLPFSYPAFSQCEVKNRLGADEVMYYYVDYVRFYWTKSKSLNGGAITDEDNYFLALKPYPFPEKPAGTKIKGDLNVTLSNDSTYLLKHFDTRYLGYDTSLLFMYVIPQKLLPLFRNNDVEEVKMMMGDEGERVYTFRLHKEAVKDQLNCLIGNLEKKKQK